MLKLIFAPFLRSFSGIPRTIWLLSLVSLVNRVGTMVIVFMTLYLTQFLHFDIRAAGYVTVFYGIGTIIGQYVGGHLTDRLGYQVVQLGSLILSGIVLLMAMFARDFWVISGIIFLLALFSEAFRPANQVAIRLNSNEITRTRAFSLLRVSVNLACSVALVVGGLLVSLGWQWLFWVDGLTCFLAAAVLVIFMKNEKQAPPQYIEQNMIEIARSAYKDKRFLLFTFFTFLGATVFMQIIWIVPLFFKEVYQWNEAKIGIISALNALIVMCFEMPLIFRIEKKRSSMWFVRFGLVLYGLSYMAFFFPIEWAIGAVILYFILISFGEIFVMPFSTSWATKHSNSTQQGQYMALYGMAYALSNVFSPFIGTQIVAAWGYGSLWIVLAAMSMLAFIGFFFIEEKMP